MGPKTKPWGTLAKMFFQEEACLFSITLYVQSFK